MNVKVYNQKGEEQGTARLSKEVFDVEVNVDLVHQVVVSQAANRRQGAAHTKSRGEVRGGGRKPWRQKGTGRARHGSIRSPIWKGGGVTFGPRKEKVYKKIVPKKMRRKALCMVLSGKVSNNLLIIIDNIAVKESKTKQIVEILKKLPCYGHSTLIALPEMNKAIITAARNIPGTETIQAKDLGALDVLSFKYLIAPKSAIKAIENTLKKDKA